MPDLTRATHAGPLFDQLVTTCNQSPRPHTKHRPIADTSRAANDQTDKQRQQWSVLKFLAGRGDTGGTFDEWCSCTGHPSSCSGRFTELRDCGLIVRTEKKRMTRAGAWSSVHVLTDEGRRVNAE